MRILLALVVLFSVSLPASVSPITTSAADCEFVLGFKTIHDLIPNIVGNCLDDATFDTGLEEELQATTGTRTDGGFGGLLVWRKADDLTWFSNGVNTWINGPQGLQERLNTERFPWELETLQNAAYDLQDTPFVLNQGSADLSTDEPNIIRLHATLDANNVAYGDLNGDGVADAAALVILNTGGSGSFNYLVAMVSSDGQTQQAAATLLGDRVKVNSTSVSDGVITVSMLDHGPNDPFCCPTVPKTASYRLVDGKLEQIG